MAELKLQSLQVKAALPVPKELLGGLGGTVRSYSIFEENWRILDEFICRRCGSQAYANPFSNSVWGCKKCGFSTDCLDVNFDAIEPADTSACEE